MSSQFRVQQLLSEFVLDAQSNYKSANHVLDYIKSFDLNHLPTSALSLFLDHIVLGRDGLLTRFSQSIFQTQPLPTKPLMKLLRLLTAKVKDHHRKSDLLPYLPALEHFSYNILVVYPKRYVTISPGTRALALRLLLTLYETKQQWVPEVAGLAPMALLASLREIYIASTSDAMETMRDAVLYGLAFLLVRTQRNGLSPRGTALTSSSSPVDPEDMLSLSLQVFEWAYARLDAFMPARRDNLTLQRTTLNVHPDVLEALRCLLMLPPVRTRLAELPDRKRTLCIAVRLPLRSLLGSLSDTGRPSYDLPRACLRFIRAHPHLLLDELAMGRRVIEHDLLPPLAQADIEHALAVHRARTTGGAVQSSGGTQSLTAAAAQVSHPDKANLRLLTVPNGPTRGLAQAALYALIGAIPDCISGNNPFSTPIADAHAGGYQAYPYAFSAAPAPAAPPATKDDSAALQALLRGTFIESALALYTAQDPSTTPASVSELGRRAVLAGLLASNSDVFSHTSAPIPTSLTALLRLLLHVAATRVHALSTLTAYASLAQRAQLWPDFLRAYALCLQPLLREGPLPLQDLLSLRQSLLSFLFAYPSLSSYKRAMANAKLRAVLAAFAVEPSHPHHAALSAQLDALLAVLVPHLLALSTSPALHPDASVRQCPGAAVGLYVAEGSPYAAWVQLAGVEADPPLPQHYAVQLCATGKAPVGEYAGVWAALLDADSMSAQAEATDKDRERADDVDLDELADARRAEEEVDVEEEEEEEDLDVSMRTSAVSAAGNHTAIVAAGASRTPSTTTRRLRSARAIAARVAHALLEASSDVLRRLDLSVGEEEEDEEADTEPEDELDAFDRSLNNADSAQRGAFSSVTSTRDEDTARDEEEAEEAEEVSTDTSRTDNSRQNDVRREAARLSHPAHALVAGGIVALLRTLALGSLLAPEALLVPVAHSATEAARLANIMLPSHRAVRGVRCEALRDALDRDTGSLALLCCELLGKAGDCAWATELATVVLSVAEDSRRFDGLAASAVDVINAASDVPAGSPPPLWTPVLSSSAPAPAPSLVEDAKCVWCLVAALLHALSRGPSARTRLHLHAALLSLPLPFIAPSALLPSLQYFFAQAAHTPAAAAAAISVLEHWSARELPLPPSFWSSLAPSLTAVVSAVSSATQRAARALARGFKAQEGDDGVALMERGENSTAASADGSRNISRFDVRCLTRGVTLEAQMSALGSALPPPSSPAGVAHRLLVMVGARPVAANALLHAMATAPDATGEWAARDRRLANGTAIVAAAGSGGRAAAQEEEAMPDFSVDVLFTTAFATTPLFRLCYGICADRRALAHDRASSHSDMVAPALSSVLTAPHNDSSVEMGRLLEYKLPAPDSTAPSPVFSLADLCRACVDVAMSHELRRTRVHALECVFGVATVIIGQCPVPDRVPIISALVRDILLPLAASPEPLAVDLLVPLLAQCTRLIALAERQTVADLLELAEVFIAALPHTRQGPIAAVCLGVMLTCYVQRAAPKDTYHSRRGDSPAPPTDVPPALLELACSRLVWFCEQGPGGEAVAAMLWAELRGAFELSKLFCEKHAVPLAASLLSLSGHDHAARVVAGDVGAAATTASLDDSTTPAPASVASADTVPFQPSTPELPSTTAVTVVLAVLCMVEQRAVDTARLHGANTPFPSPAALAYARRVGAARDDSLNVAAAATGADQLDSSLSMVDTTRRPQRTRSSALLSQTQTQSAPDLTQEVAAQMQELPVCETIGDLVDWLLLSLPLRSPSCRLLHVNMLFAIVLTASQNGDTAAAAGASSAPTSPFTPLTTWIATVEERMRTHSLTLDLTSVEPTLLSSANEAISRPGADAAAPVWRVLWAMLAPLPAPTPLLGDIAAAGKVALAQTAAGLPTVSVSVFSAAAPASLSASLTWLDTTAASMDTLSLLYALNTAPTQRQAVTALFMKLWPHLALVLGLATAHLPAAHAALQAAAAVHNPPRASISAVVKGEHTDGTLSSLDFTSADPHVSPTNPAQARAQPLPTTSSTILASLPAAFLPHFARATAHCATSALRLLSLLLHSESVSRAMGGALRATLDTSRNPVSKAMDAYGKDAFGDHMLVGGAVQRPERLLRVWEDVLAAGAALNTIPLPTSPHLASLLHDAHVLRTFTTPPALIDTALQQAAAAAPSLQALLVLEVCMRLAPLAAATLATDPCLASLGAAAATHIAVYTAARRVLTTKREKDPSSTTTTSLPPSRHQVVELPVFVAFPPSLAPQLFQLMGAACAPSLAASPLGSVLPLLNSVAALRGSRADSKNGASAHNGTASLSTAASIGVDVSMHSPASAASASAAILAAPLSALAALTASLAQLSAPTATTARAAVQAMLRAPVSLGNPALAAATVITPLPYNPHAHDHALSTPTEVTWLPQLAATDPVSRILAPVSLLATHIPVFAVFGAVAVVHQRSHADAGTVKEDNSLSFASLSASSLAIEHATPALHPTTDAAAFVVAQEAGGASVSASSRAALAYLLKHASALLAVLKLGPSLPPTLRKLAWQAMYNTAFQLTAAPTPAHAASPVAHPAPVNASVSAGATAQQDAAHTSLLAQRLLHVAITLGAPVHVLAFLQYAHATNTASSLSTSSVAAPPGSSSNTRGTATYPDIQAFLAKLYAASARAMPLLGLAIFATPPFLSFLASRVDEDLPLTPQPLAQLMYRHPELAKASDEHVAFTVDTGALQSLLQAFRRDVSDCVDAISLAVSDRSSARASPMELVLAVLNHLLADLIAHGYRTTQLRDQRRRARAEARMQGLSTLAFSQTQQNFSQLLDSQHVHVEQLQHLEDQAPTPSSRAPPTTSSSVALKQYLSASAHAACVIASLLHVLPIALREFVPVAVATAALQPYQLLSVPPHASAFFSGPWLAALKAFPNVFSVFDVVMDAAAAVDAFERANQQQQMLELRSATMTTNGSLSSSASGHVDLATGGGNGNGNGNGFRTPFSFPVSTNGSGSWGSVSTPSPTAFTRRLYSHPLPPLPTDPELLLLLSQLLKVARAAPLLLPRVLPIFAELLHRLLAQSVDAALRIQALRVAATVISVLEASLLNAGMDRGVDPSLSPAGVDNASLTACYTLLLQSVAGVAIDVLCSESLHSKHTSTASPLLLELLGAVSKAKSMALVLVLMPLLQRCSSVACTAIGEYLHHLAVSNAPVRVASVNATTTDFALRLAHLFLVARPGPTAHWFLDTFLCSLVLTTAPGEVHAHNLRLLAAVRGLAQDAFLWVHPANMVPVKMLALRDAVRQGEPVAITPAQREFFLEELWSVSHRLLLAACLCSVFTKSDFGVIEHATVAQRTQAHVELHAMCIETLRRLADAVPGLKALLQGKTPPAYLSLVGATLQSTAHWPLPTLYTHNGGTSEMDALPSYLRGSEEQVKGTYHSALTAAFLATATCAKLCEMPPLDALQALAQGPNATKEVPKHLKSVLLHFNATTKAEGVPPGHHSHSMLFALADWERPYRFAFLPEPVHALGAASVRVKLNEIATTQSLKNVALARAQAQAHSTTGTLTSAAKATVAAAASTMAAGAESGLDAVTRVSQSLELLAADEQQANANTGSAPQGASGMGSPPILSPPARAPALEQLFSSESFTHEGMDRVSAPLAVSMLLRALGVMQQKRRFDHMRPLVSELVRVMSIADPAEMPSVCERNAQWVALKLVLLLAPLLADADAAEASLQRVYQSANVSESAFIPRLFAAAVGLLQRAVLVPKGAALLAHGFHYLLFDFCMTLVTHWRHLPVTPDTTAAMNALVLTLTATAADTGAKESPSRRRDHVQLFAAVISLPQWTDKLAFRLSAIDAHLNIFGTRERFNPRAEKPNAVYLQSGVRDNGARTMMHLHCGFGASVCSVLLSRGVRIHVQGDDFALVRQLKSVMDKAVVIAWNVKVRPPTRVVASELVGHVFAYLSNHAIAKADAAAGPGQTASPAQRIAALKEMADVLEELPRKKLPAALKENTGHDLVVNTLSRIVGIYTAHGPRVLSQPDAPAPANDPIRSMLFQLLRIVSPPMLLSSSLWRYVAAVAALLQEPARDRQHEWTTLVIHAAAHALSDRIWALRAAVGKKYTLPPVSPLTAPIDSQTRRCALVLLGNAYHIAKHPSVGMDEAAGDLARIILHVVGPVASSNVDLRLRMCYQEVLEMLCKTSACADIFALATEAVSRPQVGWAELEQASAQLRALPMESAIVAELVALLADEDVYVRQRARKFWDSVNTPTQPAARVVWTVALFGFAYYDDPDADTVSSLQEGLVEDALPVAAAMQLADANSMHDRIHPTSPPTSGSGSLSAVLLSDRWLRGITVFLSQGLSGGAMGLQALFPHSIDAEEKVFHVVRVTDVLLEGRRLRRHAHARAAAVVTQGAGDDLGWDEPDFMSPLSQGHYGPMGGAFAPNRASVSLLDSESSLPSSVDVAGLPPSVRPLERYAEAARLSETDAEDKSRWVIKASEDRARAASHATNSGLAAHTALTLSRRQVPAGALPALQVPLLLLTRPALRAAVASSTVALAVFVSLVVWAVAVVQGKREVRNNKGELVNTVFDDPMAVANMRNGVLGLVAACLRADHVASHSASAESSNPMLSSLTQTRSTAVQALFDVLVRLQGQFPEHYRNPDNIPTQNLAIIAALGRRTGQDALASYLLETQLCNSSAPRPPVPQQVGADGKRRREQDPQDHRLSEEERAEMLANAAALALVHRARGDDDLVFSLVGQFARDQSSITAAEQAMRGDVEGVSNTLTAVGGQLFDWRANLELHVNNAADDVTAANMIATKHERQWRAETALHAMEALGMWAPMAALLYEGIGLASDGTPQVWRAEPIFAGNTPLWLQSLARADLSRVGMMWSELQKTSKPGVGLMYVTEQLGSETCRVVAVPRRAEWVQSHALNAAALGTIVCGARESFPMQAAGENGEGGMFHDALGASKLPALLDAMQRLTLCGMSGGEDAPPLEEVVAPIPMLVNCSEVSQLVHRHLSVVLSTLSNAVRGNGARDTSNGGGDKASGSNATASAFEVAEQLLAPSTPLPLSLLRGGQLGASSMSVLLREQSLGTHAGMAAGRVDAVGALQLAAELKAFSAVFTPFSQSIAAGSWTAKPSAALASESAQQQAWAVWDGALHGMRRLVRQWSEQSPSCAAPGPAADIINARVLLTGNALVVLAATLLNKAAMYAYHYARNNAVVLPSHALSADPEAVAASQQVVTDGLRASYPAVFARVRTLQALVTEAQQSMSYVLMSAALVSLAQGKLEITDTFTALQELSNTTLLTLCHAMAAFGDTTSEAQSDAVGQGSDAVQEAFRWLDALREAQRVLHTARQEVLRVSGCADEQQGFLHLDTLGDRVYAAADVLVNDADALAQSFRTALASANGFTLSLLKLGELLACAYTDVAALLQELADACALANDDTRTELRRQLIVGSLAAAAPAGVHGPKRARTTRTSGLAPTTVDACLFSSSRAEYYARAAADTLDRALALRTRLADATGVGSYAAFDGDGSPYTLANVTSTRSAAAESTEAVSSVSEAPFMAMSQLGSLEWGEMLPSSTAPGHAQDSKDDMFEGKDSHMNTFGLTRAQFGLGRDSFFPGDSSAVTGVGLGLDSMGDDFLHGLHGRGHQSFDTYAGQLAQVPRSTSIVSFGIHTPLPQYHAGGEYRLGHGMLANSQSLRPHAALIDARARSASPAHAAAAQPAISLVCKDDGMANTFAALGLSSVAQGADGHYRGLDAWRNTLSVGLSGAASCHLATSQAALLDKLIRNARLAQEKQKKQGRSRSSNAAPVPPTATSFARGSSFEYDVDACICAYTRAVVHALQHGSPTAHRLFPNLVSVLAPVPASHPALSILVRAIGHPVPPPHPRGDLSDRSQSPLAVAVGSCSIAPWLWLRWLPQLVVWASGTAAEAAVAVAALQVVAVHYPRALHLPWRHTVERALLHDIDNPTATPISPRLEPVSALLRRCPTHALYTDFAQALELGMFPSARITLLRDVLPRQRQGAAFDPQRAWDACYAWFFERPKRFHSAHLHALQAVPVRELSPAEKKRLVLDSRGRLNVPRTLLEWFGEPHERRVAAMTPDQRASFNAALALLANLADEATKPPASRQPVTLFDLCRWFKDFPSLHPLAAGNGSVVLEAFGQYHGFAPPTPHTHAVIGSFSPSLIVLPSIRKPMRLTVHVHMPVSAAHNAGDALAASCTGLSTGFRVHYLHKTGEDMRMDQRVEQVFDACNEAIRAHGPAHRREMVRVRTYRIEPLTGTLGLLEWVDNTVTIKKVVTEIAAAFNIKAALDMVEQRHVQYLGHASKAQPREPVPNMYKALFCMLTPQSLQEHMHFGESQMHALNFNFLRLWMLMESSKARALRESAVPGSHSMSSGAETFLHMRANMGATLAAATAAQYLIGQGDRHLDNFLLERHSGAVIPIDFGHNFGFATSRLPVPELMGVRLTPQLLRVWAPCDGLLLLKTHLTEVFAAFRKEEEALYQAMSVFARDPTLDWIKGAVDIALSISKTTGDRQPLGNDVVATDVDKNMRLALARLRGAHPAWAICEDLARSPHFGMRAPKSPYRTMCDLVWIASGAAGAPSAHRQGAVAVDGDVGEVESGTPMGAPLSVEDMVDALVNLATNPAIMTLTWVGWKPFL